MSATYLRPSTRLTAIAACAVVPVFGVAASATAACTPSAAWSETVVTAGADAVGTPTIEVPNPAYVPGHDAQDAVGEPTISIPNPAYIAPTYTPGYWKTIPAVYVPAVGEKTITVTVTNPDYVPPVDEVPEVSHTDYTAKRYVVDVKAQPAVTQKQWRYSQHGGHGFIWVDNDTFKYVDADGNGYDHKPDCDTYYERTQKTQVIEVTPAVKEQGHWDQQTFHEQPGDEWTVISTSKHVTQEHVDAQPAVGEPTIQQTIDNPAYVPAQYTPAHDAWVAPVYTPAVGPKTITVDNPAYVPAKDAVAPVGEPTLTIENPDYVPAILPSDNTVEHAAVVCTTTEPAARKSTATLAETGGELPWFLGTAGVLLLGVGACAISVGATKRNRR